MPALSRPQLLFVVLLAIFLTNALIAEFVGVKIFALEDTLGIDPMQWQLFGQSGSLSFTAGVLLWPFVFVLTDIINEYFGRRGVRFVSWLVVILIVYAFIAVYVAIHLAPASWWLVVGVDDGVPDMQAAYRAIFGQGLWTIAGSLTAFMIGQLLDVAVFHRIRRVTGERWIGLRATGSTLVSQFVDSFVVLYIAFVLGPQQWPVSLFLAVGTVNYLYKAGMAVLMTPVLYAAHAGIDRWLGAETSARLKAEAAGDLRPAPR
jgi:uncharacterized integral membrane protein (TIGR00697 family)